MLAGHTHGGQISPPPPLHHYNISQLIANWTRGRFEEGESVLYVNRGLGVAGPPVRLNCPREIARLRLVRREPPC
jgi:predicted MPP superfamily phosphohydrolase